MLATSPVVVGCNSAGSEVSAADSIAGVDGMKTVAGGNLHHHSHHHRSLHHNFHHNLHLMIENT